MFQEGLFSAKDQLTSQKVDAYKLLLRMLSRKEIDLETYQEMVREIDRAKSVEEINAVFEKFQVVPF